LRKTKEPDTKLLTLPGRPVLICCTMDDGNMQVLVENGTYSEPGAWGVVLADVIHHVANAYGQDGLDRDKVYAEIRNILVQEITKPTSEVVFLGKLEY